MPHQRIALHVTRDAQRQLRAGHPWLYDQAITKQSHAGQPGDLAVVYDDRNKFLAIGLYDPTSAIRVRVLQRRQPAPIDRRWFQARLEESAARRAPLAAEAITGYRLVHGENDGLPGLIIDRYEQTLVIKLYTAAWVPHLPLAVDALAQLGGAQRIVLRLSRTVQQQPAHLHGLADGQTLCGPPLAGPIVFQERGALFEVDPVRGQKTGFFLDQRDTRALIEQLTEGRTVLDVFAYTGGLSVCAARGGAREVVSLDASRPSLEAARRNMALNRDHPKVAAARHEVMAADAFAALRRLHRAHRSFDVVILDPPSFATNREELSSALTAYERLTRLGLDVLSPGGTLVYSCCSGHISPALFFKTVHRAATAAGHPLRELKRTGQPLDHPVGFPEGAYLKCLFAVARSPRRPVEPSAPIAQRKGHARNVLAHPRSSGRGPNRVARRHPGAGRGRRAPAR